MQRLPSAIAFQGRGLSGAGCQPAWSIACAVALHSGRRSRNPSVLDATGRSEGATDAEPHASSTVFTRFIPASRPGEGSGTWRRYYQRWPEMTLEHLGPDKVDLVPELAWLVPPAQIVDKHVYSPWMDNSLHARLQDRGVDTLAVTGGESDVCVLATVLGAIDHGYRTVVVADAICSSADDTHDASLRLYRDRYGQQVEIVMTARVLANWI